MHRLVQGRWTTDSPLMTLPYVDELMATTLHRELKLSSLPELMAMLPVPRRVGRLKAALEKRLDASQTSKVLKAAANLPVVSVSFRVKGAQSTANEALSADTEYSLEVTLQVEARREMKGPAKSEKWDRPLGEGWWLVLGEKTTGELHALKRLAGVKGGKMKSSVTFYTPETEGLVQYTVFLVSDSYMGLDQEYVAHGRRYPPPTLARG